MKVHASARRQGLAPNGAVHTAEHPVFLSDLDGDGPARQLRLGRDATGRLLEVIVLRVDSGNELLNHAMQARRQYLDRPD